MTTIKLRRGTASEWTSANPVLAQGEPGLETDTGYRKYGDGVTPWNELGYAPVPTASLPSSVVSESRGDPAPALFLDTEIGGTGSPNLSIGGTMPDLESGPPRAYSNTAFGAAYGVYGPGVPGNLVSITDGYDNTALGAGSMPLATSAHSCAAVGADTLASLTTGAYNTAVGAQSAEGLTTGEYNVAVGNNALNSATTADDNVAVGYYALASTTTNGDNTAIGFAALRQNTAAENTAVGSLALAQTTTGSNNTAVGYGAAQSNTTGANNIAIGPNALSSSRTSNASIAIGATALANATNGGHTAVGHAALEQVTGSYDTALGYKATNGNIGDVNYATSIGAYTAAEESGSVAIGCDHTGAGATASVVDSFVLGTANHKLFIPGLPTADPGVAGQLWNNSGVVSVSAD